MWHDILEGSGGGQNILENSGSGYFVGQREEKCQKEEQCLQNNLSKTKFCFRGDSTARITKPWFSSIRQTVCIHEESLFYFSVVFFISH